MSVAIERQPRYFRVRVACGHVGPGEEVTVSRYFVARDALSAWSDAARMPRVKGKTNGTGVLSVEPITPEEYEAGLVEEDENLYLAASGGTRRTWGR